MKQKDPRVIFESYIKKIFPNKSLLYREIINSIVYFKLDSKNNIIIIVDKPFVVEILKDKCALIKAYYLERYKIFVNEFYINKEHINIKHVHNLGELNHYDKLVEDEPISISSPTMENLVEKTKLINFNHKDNNMNNNKILLKFLSIDTCSLNYLFVVDKEKYFLNSKKNNFLELIFVIPFVLSLLKNINIKKQIKIDSDKIRDLLKEDNKPFNDETLNYLKNNGFLL